MVSRDPPEILAWKPRVDACALSLPMFAANQLDSSRNSNLPTPPPLPSPPSLPFDYMGPILLDHTISWT